MGGSGSGVTKQNKPGVLIKQFEHIFLLENILPK
jgi:hypothetical protein